MVKLMKLRPQSPSFHRPFPRSGFIFISLKKVVYSSGSASLDPVLSGMVPRYAWRK